MKTSRDTSVQNLKADWAEIREDLKKQHPGKLTDDDLRYEEGKEEELIGRLQQKLGKTREQVIDCLWGEWTATEEAHQADRKY